ncbi:Rv3654c family TadE-like protein [Phytoactinopolyspora halotolerans]|uniref:Flp pilus-assembly TadE/G-like family protein n=1 Tax=Phytoactinopolyspora halotolerans TaxID=1981512 RepID=A0A6L9S2U0_9ACTN|nr:Rv3654c family TadE-like protein [Phytoactinopolyspora halotolerans]NED99130.1 flp pilus-assembly TadE/G-like family protein [Phytoactinopolyspora halotolerans]
MRRLRPVDHPTRHRPRRTERGAGSVLILTVIGALLMATTVTAIIAGGQAARRQAATAADLAAIAGATRAGQDPSAACAAAAAIAEANGAELSSCTLHGLEVEVQVRVPVRGVASSWLPPQARRARAGPR